jgi:fucose permease
MGIIVLGVALVFYKIRLPEIVHEADEEEVGENGARGLWSHKLFIFGIISLFCYEIAEISINSFFINYTLTKQTIQSYVIDIKSITLANNISVIESTKIAVA